MSKRKPTPERAGRRGQPGPRRHGKPQGRPHGRPARPHASRYWLFGIHAALAALGNENRRILDILATPAFLEAHPDALDGHSFKSVGRQEMEAELPEGAVHQGIALLVAPLTEFDLADVLETVPADGRACIAILDQANDPRNIGAVLRSAAAFGVHALVVQDRNAPPETGVMAKAASGALELVPLVRITNLARGIEQLKEAGFWCIGLDGEAETPLSEMRLDGRTAFVFGAEGRGLRRLTREHCDALVRIPLDDRVESLNLANAASIALYEFAR